jgi:hypothetical protein
MPKRFTHALKLAASRAASLLLAIVCCAAATHAQKDAPASIAGRVTDGERGVPGVVVTLMSGDPSQRFKTIARTKTDAEGRFALTNVAPGRYQIMPFAPVYIVQGTSDWPPGRMLTLLGGEAVADVDFRVERGGVITGRVTDGNGNPVIAERVDVAPADNKNNSMQRGGPFDQRDQMTDDRGVYRIYGLPAGSYRVSVGQSDERGAVSLGRRKIYRRTFYPDASEAAQARLVEVKAGGEADDIDITLANAVKTYRASGRFVNAETGQPAPNVTFGYGTLDPAGRRVSSFGGGMATNTRGEFQTEGLAPGHYVVFALPQDGSELYSEPVNFEVTDADVSGVVVKLKRGVSVTGVVQIEGVSDRATVARLLGQVRVIGYVDSKSQAVVPNYSRPPTLAPDGGFRLTGLHSGTLRIAASAEGAKGLTLSRVELNGARMSDGIEVAEGAQLSGVRVVMVYGSGVIRGQVNFTNGAPPPGARLIASARRVGANGDERSDRQVEADARGFFIIEGLTAGEYEVVVRAFNEGEMYRSEAQHVSLGDGVEVSVTPALDLSKPVAGGRR